MQFLFFFVIPIMLFYIALVPFSYFKESRKKFKNELEKRLKLSVNYEYLNYELILIIFKLISTLLMV